MVFLDEAITNIMNDKTLANAGDSFVSAFQKGQNIAAQQQQMKINAIELQNKQDELAMKKNDYMFNYIGKASKLDEGPLKQAMMKQFPGVYKNATGQDLSPDDPTYTAMQKDPGISQRISSVADQLDAKFPGAGLKLKMGAELKNVFSTSGDIGESVEKIDALVKPYEEILKNQAIFGQKMTTQDIVDGQKMSMKAVEMGYGDPADVAFLRNPNNAIKSPLEFQIAKERLSVAGVSAGRKNTDIKQAGIEAGTEAKKQKSLYLTDPNDLAAYNGDRGDDAQRLAKEKNEQLSAQHKTDIDNAKLKNEQLKPQQFKEKMAATWEKIRQSAGKMSQQKENLAFRQKKALVNDPSLVKLDNLDQSINSLDGLFNRPAGEVKWTDMTLGSEDIQRIVSGSARQAQQTLSKIDFQSFMRTMNRWQSAVQNHEEGGPNADELKVLQARAGIISGVARQTYDNTLLRRINAYNISPEFNQNMFNNMHKSNTVYTPPMTSGGAPQMAAPAVVSGGTAMTKEEKAKERQRAMNAIQQIQAGQGKGATVESVKKRFEDKTKEKF